jgi:phenol/toluene 2-monooxygenase (NADH) P4/A4
MPWEDFKAQILDPWAGWDPGYDPVAATGWKLDETPFDPQAGQTLADLGVEHKGLIRFHT